MSADLSASVRASTELENLLAAYRQDPLLAAQLTELLPAMSDQALTAALDEMLQTRFGTRLAGVHALEVSVGCVFGLTDDQGQKRALKLLAPLYSPERLDVIRALQKNFWQQGYPAPQPLSEVFCFGGGPGVNAWVDAWVEGDLADGHDEAARRELATQLARFAAIAETLPLPAVLPPLTQGGRRIWPEGANLKFRISHHQGRGAGWLMRRARKARSLLLSGRLPQMIGFSDWGVKNTRFCSGKLCVLYDWDSLLAMSEPEMVGQAAAQFTACWDFPTRITPSRAESLAFVRDYEQARGKTFGPEQWTMLAAAAEQLVTYIARLEHQLNQGRTDAELTPYKHLAAATGEDFFLPLTRPRIQQEVLS